MTCQTLSSVFKELEFAGVQLDGILLKPNMVISGKGCPTPAHTHRIAELTLKCFREYVPAQVPGIVFLSGGQSEEEATLNLQTMNAVAGELPWELSFSYGRALQQSALRAWRGQQDNASAAQDAFLNRARLTSAARSGKYKPEMESARH